MNSTGLKAPSVHDGFGVREAGLGAEEVKHRLAGRDVEQINHNTSTGGGKTGMVWSQRPPSVGMGVAPPQIDRNPNFQTDYDAGYPGGEWNVRPGEGYDPSKISSHPRKGKMMMEGPRDSPLSARPVMSPQDQAQSSSRDHQDAVMIRSGSETHLMGMSGPGKHPGASRAENITPRSTPPSLQSRMSPTRRQADIKPKSRYIHGTEPGSARQSPAGSIDPSHRTPTPSGSHSSRSGSPNRYMPPNRPQNGPPMGMNSVGGSPTRLGSSISRSGSPRRAGPPCSPTRLGSSMIIASSPTKLGSSVGRRESPPRFGASVMRVGSPTRLGSSVGRDSNRYSGEVMVEHGQGGYYRPTSPSRQSTPRSGSPARQGRVSPVRQNPRQYAGSPPRQNASRNGSPFRPGVSRSPERGRVSPTGPRIPDHQNMGPGRPGADLMRQACNPGGARPVYRGSPKAARNSPSPQQRRSGDRKGKEVDPREQLPMMMGMSPSDYERSLAAAAAAGQLVRPEYLLARYPMLVPGAANGAAGLPIMGNHFLPHLVLQQQQQQLQQQLQQQEQLRQQQMREQQAAEARRAPDARRPGPDGRVVPNIDGQVGLASLPQLQQLWQRKYPTHDIPPPWMLYQYQDELLRDTTLPPSINTALQHPPQPDPRNCSPRDAGPGRDRSAGRPREDGRPREPGVEVGRTALPSRAEVERMEWGREKRMREEQNEREKKAERGRQLDSRDIKLADRENLRMATMAAMGRLEPPWDPTPRDTRRPPNHPPNHVSARPPSQPGQGQRDMPVVRGEGCSASDAVNQHFEESLMRIGLNSQKVEATGPLEVSMPVYASTYSPGFTPRGQSDVPLVSPNPYSADKVKIERQQNPAAMAERARRRPGEPFDTRPISRMMGNPAMGNSINGRNPRQEIPTFNLAGYRPDMKYHYPPGHVIVDRVNGSRQVERGPPADEHGKNPGQEIPMLSRAPGRDLESDMKSTSVIVDRRGIPPGGNPTGQPPGGIMPAGYRGGGSITLGTAAHHYRPEGPDWQQQEALRALHGAGPHKGAQDVRGVSGGNNSRPTSRHSREQPRFSPVLNEQQQHWQQQQQLLQQQQQQQQRWPTQNASESQRFAPPTNFSAEHLIERRELIGSARGPWDHSATNHVSGYPSRDQQNVPRAPRDPSPATSVQSSSLNLIQQGLVPNPLYSSPIGGGVPQHPMMHLHPRGPPGLESARGTPGTGSPALDGKRRNGRKEPEGPERKRFPEGAERYPDDAYRYPGEAPPASQPLEGRATSAFHDSFKMFVDRTVQDAFYSTDEPRQVVGEGVRVTDKLSPGGDEEERKRAYEARVRQLMAAEQSRSSPAGWMGVPQGGEKGGPWEGAARGFGGERGVLGGGDVVNNGEGQGEGLSRSAEDSRGSLVEIKNEENSEKTFNQSNNVIDGDESAKSSSLGRATSPDYKKSSEIGQQGTTPPQCSSPATGSSSPPLNAGAGASGHPYAKKAWLQRYSHQDKKVGDPAQLQNEGSDSQGPKKFEPESATSTVDVKPKLEVKEETEIVKLMDIDVKKEIKEETKDSKLGFSSKVVGVGNSIGFSRFGESPQGGATVVKSEPTSTSSDLEDNKPADSIGTQRKTRPRRNKERAAAASSSSQATSSKRSSKDNSCGGRGRGPATADSPPMPKLVQEESPGSNSLHLADSSDNVDSPCRSSSGRLGTSSRAGTPERPHLGGGRGRRGQREVQSGTEQDEEEDEEADEEQDMEEDMEEESEIEEGNRRSERRNKHTSDCESKLAMRDLNTGRTRGSPSGAHTEGGKPVSMVVGGRSADKKRRRGNKEPFLQDGSCSDLTPKLFKCRECKMSRAQRNKSTPNIFCRFFAFRKLRYSTKGVLTVSGFLRPMDADADDISLWMPLTSEGEMLADQAKYILSHVVNSFNKLAELEKKSVQCLKQTCVSAAASRKLAWKRALQGVREMCDACNATLFNLHWACHKCGFAVCAQCFAERAIGCGEDLNSSHRKDATCDWLTCSANRQHHELDSLMLTQIIPSDVQTVINRMLEEVLDKYSITINQSQPAIQELSGRDLYEFTNGDSDSAASDESRPSRCSGSSSYGIQNGGDSAEKRRKRRIGEQRNGETHDYDDDDDDDDETCPPPLKRLGADSSSSSRRPFEGKRCMVRMDRILPHRIIGGGAVVVEPPHRYLQERRLLYLTDPLADNVELFQKHWQRALPVLVADCTGTTAIPDLWTPDSFRREFAGLRADLVDCASGAILRGQSTEKFWSGFEAACNISGNSVTTGNSGSGGNAGKQKSGTTGNSGTAPSQPVLRLKDWPAVDDPIGARWHRDLARTLPIREYTLPTGVFNLISHLPEFFGRPELAVRIHAGYGSAAQAASVAFSRLRSSLADCVNVLMYVEAPANETDAQKAALTKSLKEAGCCNVIKFVSGLAGKKVGAVWHIFRPQDAGKIKEFLTKQQQLQQSGRQAGLQQQQKHDKCHSSSAGNGFNGEGGVSGFDGHSWYLDRSLRNRLQTEYDVHCCTVVQCHGDAVFIPALSPYQVKNLYSCISASKEFLSPEGIDLCYEATQQLRQASISTNHGSENSSDSSTPLPLIDLLDNNQEEMLQVENVVFHAVKSSISVLRESEET